MVKDIAGVEWPWQELNMLSGELYTLAKTRTREIMLAAGENPDGNDKLFRIRVGQALFGANSRAHREASRP
jgi:hypothetical protein